MTGNDVREKYLKFFEKRGHKRITPAPLVLKDDPTTLFTSSGMQPLVPFLMGKKYKGGLKRLTDSQPLIRVQDIEDVGDDRHDTFFEMLGNWSLGDYFKKDQLNWIFEFLTSKDEGLGLDPNRIYVTVFEGNESVPKDTESIEIWKEIFKKHGIDAKEEKRIFAYPARKNWWSRAGTPSEMPDGEIGGPDSEMFFDFGPDLKIHEHSAFKNEKCHPNCDCGRYVEIGNSVFVQYKKEGKKLVELSQKNVDFGGGLERLTAATENSPDAFKISLFWPLIEKIEQLSSKKYEDYKADMQIIADHLKASCFLIADGVVPMNKLQGYVLRRLLRRAAIKGNNLGLEPVESFRPIVQSILEDMYSVPVHYFDRRTHMGSTSYVYDQIIDTELRKFNLTLKRGLKELEKLKEDQLNALNAFNLYQSYGFPFEVTQELFKQKGKELSREQFNEAMREHQELSRKSSKKKFSLK